MKNIAAIKRESKQNKKTQTYFTLWDDLSHESAIFFSAI